MAFGQCPWNDWTFVGTKLDGCVSRALSVKASFPTQGGSTFLHPHKEFSKVYNFFVKGIECLLHVDNVQTSNTWLLTPKGPKSLQGTIGSLGKFPQY
jgi:hypothetical protein